VEEQLHAAEITRAKFKKARAEKKERRKNELPRLKISPSLFRYIAFTE